MIAASIGIELARTFGQRTGIAKRMSGKAWTSVKQQIAVFHKLDNGVSAVTRALTNSGQPLSSIAYASGYCDYTHFARVYRRRLVVFRAQQQRVRSDPREPPVRPHTGLCAPCAHDSPKTTALDLILRDQERRSR